MRIFAAAVLMATLSFAGCSHGFAPPVVSPGFTSAGVDGTLTGTYRVFYSFAPSSGATPQSALHLYKGTFYGTTLEGGAYLEGSVYSLTTAGKETLLYSFHQGYPQASLITVGTTFYGTTAGSSDSSCSGGMCGTVFTIGTTGKARTVYSFKGGKDGAQPVASLTNVNGTLYGTTSEGGAVNGTVFAVGTDGKERVLHAFTAGNDGSDPESRVIAVSGVLYGTTISGGKNGYGTVYRVTTAGKETVLYAFAGGSDGAGGYAALTYVSGAFYGTTGSGGGTGCGGFGCGTVYKLTPAGKESVIYRFKGGKDGAAPRASLTYANGAFYGTTSGGGAYSRGTVFKVSPNGVEQVLHSFKGGTDGSTPYASLIYANGTLYGTTNAGGKYNSGTAFSLKNP